MSSGLRLLSSNVAGHGLPEGRYLPGSGISGAAALQSHSCHGSVKPFSRVKILLRGSYVGCSKRASLTCMATSGGPKRNPDFSRQSKRGLGFSRGKNRQNDDRDNSDNLEETELLTSKNGPLLSLSGSPRFQATATPGPREKEIVELFRKVQAQLRERAAIKEEKKIEALQGQGERGTVDSLLKLLRKHSVDQGKTRSGSEDYNLDQQDTNSSFDDGQSSDFLSSNSIARDEVQEPRGTSFGRPASNFRRKSPVPRVRYQPIYSTEESLLTPSKSQGNKKKTVRMELDPAPVSLDVNNEVDEFQGVNDEEVSDMDDEVDELSVTSDVDETHDGSIEQSSASLPTNLSSLKLSELKDLAKSRGLKGYSKLKKKELVSLLDEGTV
ncbi:rho-N domain-containing protein 1, chloroplastic [Aristolochia californica]|uniref:rho-N domain-containing protein 1, chloroplastic n=1 Tax=Aristolochia californica TaxID=171875 RepID=UPI0035DF30FD